MPHNLCMADNAAPGVWQVQCKKTPCKVYNSCGESVGSEADGKENCEGELKNTRSH